MKKFFIATAFLCSTVSVFASSIWTMNTSCGIAVEVTMTKDDPTVAEVTAAWNATNATTCPGSKPKKSISIQS